MQIARLLRWALIVALAIALNGCGGGSSTDFAPPTQGTKQGTVFVVGTDAPLASVLAFRVTFTGMTASDGTNTVTLLSQAQDIEFARLNGLRTLLDLRSVPVGTYTSVTMNLASPVISYLDMSTTPPSVLTINGTLMQSNVTVLLHQPLVVTENGLVGLHMDFRLRDSLERDAAGQITGGVNPRIAVRAIPPDAPDAEIDELRGGVVSVDVANRSFVMQGPHGRTLTVVTDDQTQFEEGEGLSSLNTNTIAQVSGSLQRITKTLRATEVLIVSQERFLLGGLITDVRPPTGRADQMDLLVRTELPDLASAQVGRISTLNFDGNERFMIHHLRLPFTPFLFNRASLVRGQRVTAGGALDSTTNPPALDVRRVVLHPQGLEGVWVVGSTNTTTKAFSFRVDGLVGIVFGQPLRVFTSDRTKFINLSGVGDLGGDAAIRLRVVGLVLQDDVSGKPIVIARIVEKIQAP